MGNAVTLRADGREIADLPNAKVLTRRLAGRLFTVRAPAAAASTRGRAGSEKVAYDVRQGYVSLKAALDVPRRAGSRDAAD
jgi:hypothetical protein